MGFWMGMARTARPWQWTKNVLVVAAPAAAGRLGEGDVLATTLLAFAAFCVVSSGTYLFNDARDVASDRLHPTKQARPVAAGVVSVRAATIGGAVLLAGGLAIAAAGGWRLLAIVAGYVALTTVYTLFLKQVPVFDIAAVAAGFFLRAIAGGVASDILLSRWFLIVTGGGSLFIVTAKRYAECRSTDDAALRRRTLDEYSEDYLRAMLSTTAAVTVVAYCLWAFEAQDGEDPSNWKAISAAVFTLGVMRYGLLVDQGHGEEPQDLLLADRTLQLLGVAWLGVLARGVAA